MQIDWEALCRTVTLFAVIFPAAFTQCAASGTSGKSDRASAQRAGR